MQIDSGKIGPDDPRYLAVVEKRFNKRFRATPDYVRLASSTEQVVAAVEEAVREGRRLVVTSGGHCLENFTSDPEVRVILDVSPMKRIDFDAERGAIAVEAGATVGETFRTLFERWGVLIPLGEHPDIGMGGHVAGGAEGIEVHEIEARRLVADLGEPRADVSSSPSGTTARLLLSLALDGPGLLGSRSSTSPPPPTPRPFAVSAGPPEPFC